MRSANTQNTKLNEELVKDYVDSKGDVIFFCKYYSHMSYKMKLAMDTKTELVVESIKYVLSVIWSCLQARVQHKRNYYFRGIYNSRKYHYISA